MRNTVKAVVIAVVGIAIIFILAHLFTPQPYKPALSSSALSGMDLAENWREYRSPSKRFAVSLPAPPQHAVESVAVPSSGEKIRYDMFLAQAKRGTIYVVNIIDYPPSVDVANIEAVLSMAVNEIVAGNQANHLLKADRGLACGWPSMDFVIGNPEATIYGRSIVKGSSLFVVSVADHDSQVAQEAFKKLSDSFRITE